MPLPSNLTTITLTGTFLDSTGAPLSGSITFTPPPELVDPGNAIMYATTVTANLDSSGHFSVTLVCTDNGSLLPVGWFYTVVENIKGTRTYPLYVPHTLGASADLSNLTPVPSLTGSPAVIPSGVVAPGYGGLAYDNTWTGANIFTGAVTLTALDITGAVTLTTPLPLAQGGTGQTSAQAAINTLTGAQSAGKYLRSDGTNAVLTALQAADVPVLNQSTTGSAANVTGTVALANGGTGQTSAAAAFNALSPNTTLGDVTYASGAGTNARLAGNTAASKKYLTQTGTGTASAAPAWGAIAAADLPTATTLAQGAVQLDGTAGDMQTLGIANAGASGQAADAKHVHPFASIVATSSVTITGVTAATLASSGFTIPIAGLYAGMAFEVDIWGTVTTTASTQTITTNVFLGGVGGTQLVNNGPTQPNSSGTVTNVPYRYRARLTFPSATTASCAGEMYTNFFLNNSAQSSGTAVAVATAKQLVIGITPSATAVSVTIFGSVWKQVG